MDGTEGRVRTEPTQRTVLSALLAFMSGVVGAYGASFTLNVRALLHGPLFMTARYSGVDGAVRGLIEFAYVCFAGAAVFGRLGWLVGQRIGRRVWKEPEASGRLRNGARIFDRAFVPPILLLWIYLICASW